jgi:hypothetical protein
MKAKAKPRRQVAAKSLPKLVTHRQAAKPPRVGDGSGRWKPKVGH